MGCLASVGARSRLRAAALSARVCASLGIFSPYRPQE